MSPSLRVTGGWRLATGDWRLGLAAGNWGTGDG